MNYTENYKGVKLDVQAVDFTIGESVQQTIRDVIDKLEKFTGRINFADVYLRMENTNKPVNKYVSIRLGIPGPDAFADDRGEHWEPTLRSVGQKIERQLRKVKA